ncbi:MAG: DUF349 domain-containing protein [Flavobacteriales bacterium]|nr:DUF349 domain-containing protein [Flavobacteriales bacterium]
MATKAELITKLEELIGHDDVEHAAEAVDTVKEAYEAIIAAELENASVDTQDDPETTDDTAETAKEPPVSIDIESVAPQDEDDKRFKQLMDGFNQRVNDIRRKKAKEEAENLKEKHAVMEELKAMISGEENIGTAFQRFSDLQEKWKTIGPVPQQAYRDLQADYSHLLDEFFYHIRIYKELRDHDLRKNTVLKQALISDMISLGEKDNIKELETQVKDYQDKWHQVGPVVREEWEAIRDGFWNATRVVYDKVHEHYKARRAEHDANLQAKQHLVERVLAIAEQTKDVGSKEWKALTDQVLEAQNAWKAVGFATKKDNERIWKEFRNACNTFFDAKKAHYDQIREQFKEAKDKKVALLEQALALKDSTEWRQTADKLKALQSQWKAAGNAGLRDENKLWAKFRDACDGFFSARKSAYAKIDEEQAENVKQKEKLLKEIEAFTLSGERNADIEKLKDFSARWMNSGRVSPKLYDGFSDRYRAALDKHYGQLKMEVDERQKLRFKDHMDNLKSGPDGKDRIERESRFIKRKIEELETEKRTIEANMGMFNFKSKSGEAMKLDLEKKIQKLERDVERLKDQHKELLKELREQQA